MIIALALLAAAADPADAPVAAYADCLVAQARVLDDGRSDAATIARTVREECRAPERDAAIALAGDRAAPAWGIIVARIEAGGMSRAVRAVLRVRGAGR